MSMWNIVYNGQPIGPMTTEQLRAYGLNPNTMVQQAGSDQWLPAFNFPELMALIQQNNGFGYVSNSGKDKIVAGILALLIGSLGIHYFYIGKTTAGIITIILSLVTCGFWSIITLIQGIIMLTMDQQQFDHKYVFTDKSFPLF